MTEALYGATGFYRRPGVPGQHFRTAAHTSPLWAAAWARLALRVAADVEAMTVVEVGAGGGELIGGLAALVPPHWRLVGVDVCPRPSRLPDRVEWSDAVPAAFEGLLLAVEWLDVVPVDVVELTTDGVRYIEVTTTGQECVGGPIDSDAQEWLRTWWPLAEVGDRAEIGAPRDDAWRDAVTRMRRGVAAAVDYAADPSRDVAGTLTGYRAGRQVLPVPDGSCDITAHVLIESCAAAVDGLATHITSQRHALQALGVRATRPAYDGDTQGYLAQLQDVGEAAELLDPNGLGGFTWLVQAKGVELPL